MRSSEDPWHKEDRPLDERAMGILFPEQERAWECVLCGLCYHNSVLHMNHCPARERF